MACSKVELFCRVLPETMVNSQLTPYSVDLEKIFHLMNAVCFKGAIQKWKICWDNSRMRDYVGFVDYDYQCLVLNPRICDYLEYSEITDAILHQMIHIRLWLKNPEVQCDIHDPIFKGLQEQVLSAWEDIELPSLR